MKKTIYLLNIDNYAPEITSVTYPLIERYADKIGAEIVMITERKYPDAAPVYEKLQIYELEKERRSDWIIYVDSDCIIHPDFYDITAVLPAKTVFQKGSDFSASRFRPNKYMLKDRRFIGTCNWFTVFPKECLELFNPDIGMTLEEIYAECFPTVQEGFSIDEKHLVDDYILSTNLAKHGFKYMTMSDIAQMYPNAGGEFLYHEYLIPDEVKAEVLAQKKKDWCETNLRMIDLSNIEIV